MRGISRWDCGACRAQIFGIDRTLIGLISLICLINLLNQFYPSNPCNYSIYMLLCLSHISQTLDPILGW